MNVSQQRAMNTLASTYLIDVPRDATSTSGAPGSPPDPPPPLIDDKGEEFTSAEPPEGAVELTGDIDSGSTEAQDAVAAIAALSDDVRHQVATLEVTDSYSLQFTMKDDRRIFWGASDKNNDDKARAFATVLKMEGREWNISNPELVTTRG